MREMIKESIMQSWMLKDNIETARIAGKEGVRDLDWQQSKVKIYDKIRGESQMSKSEIAQLTASVGAGALGQEKNKEVIQA